MLHASLSRSYGRHSVRGATPFGKTDPIRFGESLVENLTIPTRTSHPNILPEATQHFPPLSRLSSMAHRRDLARYLFVALLAAGLSACDPTDAALGGLLLDDRADECLTAHLGRYDMVPYDGSAPGCRMYLRRRRLLGSTYFRLDNDCADMAVAYTDCGRKTTVREACGPGCADQFLGGDPGEIVGIEAE